MQDTDIFKINENVKRKLVELEKVADQYPEEIPVQVVCSLLGIGLVGLRACMANGKCPFALCWKQDGKKNRAFFIATVPFYLWYKHMMFCQTDINNWQF